MSHWLAWNFQVESIKSSMKVHLYTHKDGRIWLCFFYLLHSHASLYFYPKTFRHLSRTMQAVYVCILCVYHFFSCTKKSYPLSISPNKSIALTQITMNAIDHWDSSIKTYVSLCHFIYSTVWLKWHLYIYLRRLFLLQLLLLLVWIYLILTFDVSDFYSYFGARFRSVHFHWKII